MSDRARISAGDARKAATAYRAALNDALDTLAEVEAYWHSNPHVSRRLSQEAADIRREGARVIDQLNDAASEMEERERRKHEAHNRERDDRQGRADHGDIRRRGEEPARAGE